MSVSNQMRRTTSCIDHRHEAPAQAQWHTRAQAGPAQPDSTEIGLHNTMCARRKRAHRRGGGVLVGVQPPLQRLVGRLQPHLVHVKGRRPAGMWGTSTFSLQHERYRRAGRSQLLESDVEQVLLLCGVDRDAHRSRSRKRSAVGTAGWMTLHWLQKKKDTRGTCGVQPCTFRHIGTCTLPLMWRACLGMWST